MVQTHHAEYTYSTMPISANFLNCLILTALKVEIIDMEIEAANIN